MPAAPLTPDSAIAVATAGPKSVAASLVPATGGRTVDEELVIIEDVLEDEDNGLEDEDEEEVYRKPASCICLTFTSLPEHVPLPTILEQYQPKN
jgi:hypothetical protein